MVAARRGTTQMRSGSATFILPMCSQGGGEGGQRDGSWRPGVDLRRTAAVGRPAALHPQCRPPDLGHNTWSLHPQPRGTAAPR